MKAKSLMATAVAGALMTLGFAAHAQYATHHDLDRDGIENRYDRDRDGDGIVNHRDRHPDRYDVARRGPAGDRDGDGVVNRYDRDRDGDGIVNRQDARPGNPRRG